MERKTNLTKQEKQLLWLLKVGRKNIKKTKQLLNEMQIPNTRNGERHFREIIRSLRMNHKVPILSMKEHRVNGYFIAENTGEILEFTTSIKSQLEEGNRMLSAVITNDLEGWKELLKGV